MKWNEIFGAPTPAPAPAPIQEQERTWAPDKHLTPVFTSPPKPCSYLAWDTETYLIEPGNLTPKLVSVQWQIVDNGQRQAPVVAMAGPGANFIRSVLFQTDTVFVSHNGFYDWAVLLAHYNWDEELFLAVVRAVQTGRVRDTLVRAKLHAIANGWLDFDPQFGSPAKFDLGHLTYKYTGGKVEGKYGQDVWRLRYSELDGIPVEQWPAEAYEYARLDPKYTADVFEAIDYTSPDELMQTEKAWWMHLASVGGLETDPARVHELEHRILPAIAEGLSKLVELGVYRPEERTVSRDKVKAKFGLKDTTAKSLGAAGLKPLSDPTWLEDMDVVNIKASSKDMTKLRSLISEAYEGSPPLTDKGSVATDRKTLKQVPILAPLVEIGEFQKVQSTYLPVLKQPVVNPRGNPLVASGRVSYSGPNIANQPRLAGVRECWKAPSRALSLGEGWEPGKYLLLSADYSQAELASLAQVCIDKFGFSKMGDLINEGVDLHLYFVSHMYNVPYAQLKERKKEEQVKAWRQSGKAANFGFPGGLGIAKFVQYAKDSYGVEMSEEQARAMKAAWLSAFPEVQLLFNWMGHNLLYADHCSVVQHRSGRVRGRVGYTDGLNTMFQGLTADGASLAINRINTEAWTDRDSPIYGVRMVGFFYDEFFGAIPDRGPESNHWACLRICEILKDSMHVFTPDVVARVEPALMSNWSKAADPVYNEQGFLIPYN